MRVNVHGLLDDSRQRTVTQEHPLDGPTTERSGRRTRCRPCGAADCGGTARGRHRDHQQRNEAPAAAAVASRARRGDRPFPEHSDPPGALHDFFRYLLVNPQLTFLGSLRLQGAPRPPARYGPHLYDVGRLHLGSGADSLQHGVRDVDGAGLDVARPPIRWLRVTEESHVDFDQAIRPHTNRAGFRDGRQNRVRGGPQRYGRGDD